MKKKLMLGLFFVPLAITASCGTAKKEVKVTPQQQQQQAELEKKYQNLLNEIDAMKDKLAKVKDEKKATQEKITYLKTQIAALEAEKTSLQKELSAMPSRESLEQELQTLQAQLGGEQ
ncbi:hypothetical protein [Desulfurobacterium sp.]